MKQLDKALYGFIINKIFFRMQTILGCFSLGYNTMTLHSLLNLEVLKQFFIAVKV